MNKKIVSILIVLAALFIAAPAFAQLNGTLTLLMKGTSQRATIHISNGRIRIDGTTTANKLCLTDRELVSLLFGIEAPSNILDLGKNALLLDSIFPLDFYTWHYNGV